MSDYYSSIAQFCKFPTLTDDQITIFEASNGEMLTDVKL